MTTDTQAEPRNGAHREPRHHGPEAPAAPQSEPYVPTFSGTSLFAPRGRHRKPRPRRLLLALGCLALAVGALSLVRLTPESGVGGVGDLGGNGTAEAGPRPDPDAITSRERATGTASTVPAVPQVSPAATSALREVSTTPVSDGAGVVPASSDTVTAPAPPAPSPDATTIPDTPNAPAPSATRTAPHPAPTPPPRPPEGDKPGLCVPVIGLCLDSPADRHRRPLRH